MGVLTGRLDPSVGDRGWRPGAIGEQSVAPAPLVTVGYARSTERDGLTEFFVAPDSRVTGVGRALHHTAVRAIVSSVAETDGR